MAAVWDYDNYVKSGRPILNSGDKIINIPDGEHMIYPIPLQNCDPPPCKIIDVVMCEDPEMIEIGQWGCQMPYIWAPQHDNEYIPSQIRLLDVNKSDNPEIAAYSLGSLTLPSRTTVDHTNNCCYVVSSSSPGPQLAKIDLYLANKDVIPLDTTSYIDSTGNIRFAADGFPDPCLRWKVYFNGNGDYIETRYNTKSPYYSTQEKTLQQNDPLTNTNSLSDWAESPKGLCVDKDGNIWTGFFFTQNKYKGRLYKFNRNGELLDEAPEMPFLGHIYGLHYYNDMIIIPCPRPCTSNNFKNNTLPPNYPDFNKNEHVSGLFVYNIRTRTWKNILPNRRSNIIYLYNIIIVNNDIYGTIVGGPHTGRIFKQNINDDKYEIIGDCGGINTFLRGLCFRDGYLYVASSNPGATIYKVDINNGKTDILYLPNINGDSKVTGVGVDHTNRIWVMGLYEGYHIIYESDIIEYIKPNPSHPGKHYTYSDFVGRENYIEEGRWLT